MVKIYTGNRFNFRTMLAIFLNSPSLASNEHTHYHVLLPRVHSWASAQAVVLAVSVSLPRGIVQWWHCRRVFQRRPVTLFAHSSEQDLCKLSGNGLHTHTYTDTDTHTFGKYTLALTQEQSVNLRFTLLLIYSGTATLMAEHRIDCKSLDSCTKIWVPWIMIPPEEEERGLHMLDISCLCFTVKDRQVNLQSITSLSMWDKYKAGYRRKQLTLSKGKSKIYLQC